MQIQIQKIKINNPLQRTVGIIGQKGSGKTILMILIWRACREKNISSVFFDTLNQIRYKNKLIIKKWDSEETKQKMILVTKRLIEKAIQHKASIVIAFKDLIPHEIQDFCNSLFPVTRFRNCMVFFDEIHEYAPELVKGSEEIQRFIRHCRNYNVGIVFNTQRPAMVKKNIFALVDLLIIMRTVWLADLKIVAEYLKNAGYTEEKVNYFIKEVQNLKTFEGYKIDFF